MVQGQRNQTGEDREDGEELLICLHCGGTGQVEFGPNKGETCCHCGGSGRCPASEGSASCCSGAFGAGYNG